MMESRKIYIKMNVSTDDTDLVFIMDSQIISGRNQGVDQSGKATKRSNCSRKVLFTSVSTNR